MESNDKKCDNKNSKNGKDIEEISDNKIPYPKGAYFILFATICIYAAFYGMTGGIVFYWQRVLGLSASSSSTTKTVIDAFNNFVPVIGAILADVYLGQVMNNFFKLVD